MTGINYLELQEKLKEDPELTVKVLEKLDYQDVKDKQKYFACRNKDGDNASAMVVWKESLQYTNYTRGHEGNIFTLVMTDLKFNFPKALEWIAKSVGFSGSYDSIRLPFHSFYKKIMSEQSGAPIMLEEYDRDVLPPADNYSYKFYLDHIDIDTQRQWGVRYSFEEDAILIPIEDINGRLIGVKARNNTEIDSAHRYYAYKPYQKNAVVYGLSHNYLSIVHKKKLIIFEAEKSVLQCYSFGLYIAVAIAGHSISKAQATIIKSLMCEEIIVAFDEGICEEEIIYESRKLLVDNKLCKNKVSYLYDRDKKYLGEKDSPSDNGKEILMKILKECKYEVKNDNKQIDADSSDNCVDIEYNNENSWKYFAS